MTPLGSPIAFRDPCLTLNTALSEEEIKLKTSQGWVVVSKHPLDEKTFSVEMVYRSNAFTGYD